VRRSNSRKTKIVRARSGHDIEEVRKLLTEYSNSLDFDLSFQDFDRELADLPGEYSTPWGEILIAKLARNVAGMVALRRLGNNLCEMKRLYVRPSFRGKGIGKILAESIIREARQIGYRKMRLDTVPSMVEAIRVYDALGFKRIKPYTFNPVEGALYMELTLV
jgi:putative acetyltransferase